MIFEAFFAFVFLGGGSWWFKQKKERQMYESKVREIYLSTNELCHWDIESKYGNEYVPHVITATYGGIDVKDRLQEYANSRILSFRITPSFLFPYRDDLDKETFQECKLDVTYQAKVYNEAENN